MFDTSPRLDRNGRVLALDVPRVMGIVNVTPDSFSDGGAHDTVDAAVAHGLQLAQHGAAILDIGGESTRPGAAEVSIEEELRRVIPIVERLAAETTLPLSIDTSKPEVMRAAVAAGAGMINDVYGLRRDGALEAAAGLGVPVVLMHMQGEPRTMQASPEYDDVVRAAAASPVDPRNLAGDLAGVVGGVEGGDRAGARLAVEDVLPGDVHPVSEGGQKAEAGDDDTTHGLTPSGPRQGRDEDRSNEDRRALPGFPIQRGGESIGLGRRLTRRPSP